MAKVFLAPELWEPDYGASWSEYRQREQEYIQRQVNTAKENSPNDKLAGEIISFPRGDGYAQYLVWKSKPLQLIWLQVGDAWDVEEPLLRGLRLKDVQAMVERERRVNELFRVQR